MTATLIHTPMACSLAVRIAAAELGVQLEIVENDPSTKMLDDGRSLWDLNPLGTVSVLELDDGRRLTESVAVLMWVATEADPQLGPRSKPELFFELLRWLGIMSTELHSKLFRVVFYDETDEASKGRFRALAARPLAMVEAHMEGLDHLVGDRYSVADAELTWILTLLEPAGIDLAPYPVLAHYAMAMGQRPETASVLADDRQRRARRRAALAAGP